MSHAPKMQLSHKITILVIDDEVDFLKAVESLYGQFAGVTVTTCTSPESAVKELEKNYFSIVIADEYFKKTSRLSGKEFIEQNINGLLRNSKVFLVSGQTEKIIKIKNELQQIGVPALDKDTEWQEVVENCIEKEKEERKKEIDDFLSNKPDLKLSPLDAKYDDDAKNILTEWLETLPSQENKVYVMGGQALNATELIQHVENETNIGRRLYRMFKREIRKSFNLKNENGSY